jgi:2Fe-2S ferredoxin
MGRCDPRYRFNTVEPTDHQTQQERVPMRTVTIRPSGIELPVDDGETVAEAAWRQGYTWPTTCFGQAECTICWVTVLEGADRVSTVEADEAEALQSVLAPQLFSDDVRLACRLSVVGDGVVLQKKGVRPPGDG